MKLILQIQEKWDSLEDKKIENIVNEFNVSTPTAKKYISMSMEEINALKEPANYNKEKKKTVIDDYINIIYKMARDNIKGEIIYFYIKYKGYIGNNNTLGSYISVVGTNNFPKFRFHTRDIMISSYTEEITVIKRNDLLKHILTKDPKKKKDETISKNLEIIKAKYRIVEEVETIFSSFHSTIMGSNVSALDSFLDTYNDSKIKSFCDGIKKDIEPVKNAISLDISSGFVEGNNNKFKLIKRIVYGKSGLVNLFKKCFLAFAIKKEDFNLFDLV